MKYPNITKAKFLSRPNRFIAICEINGKQEVCHVKNTGRCRELLIPDCEVYLVKSDNPNRKTAYDLVSVNKNGMMINMDSQAPNKAVKEWLENTQPFGEDIEIHPETVYGNSRFDFYLKSKNTDRQIYMEVKGCTLEKDGTAMFPDAPTERGVKHLNELISCTEKGIEAAIMILVQMKGINYFTPNYETHPEFGETLKQAKNKGVTLLCFDSIVTPSSIEVGDPVEIRL